MAFLVGLLLLSCLVGAQAVCSDANSKDICIVSAENGQTCSWCVGANNQGACANSTAVEELKTRPAFTCDSGDDIVFTRAPVMSEPLLSQVQAFADDYIPVVFMHGLGDSGHNKGMQSLAQSVMTTYPGSYAVSVDVADGLSSYTEDIGKQVDDFAAVVKADPKLAKGFNLAGLSQGGLIARAYAEVYNDPPVHLLMSLCGTQDGVGDCPGGTPEFLCNLVRESLYEAPVSFAGYWKNSLDKDKYLKDSKHLAFWNNERDDKNSTYADRMRSLNTYVLIQALNDTVVIPHQSENHQFYPWGSNSPDNITDFTQTDSYLGDWIGIQTLDSQNKIFHHSYIGNHLRWSQEFWDTTVLPYFNQTWSQFETRRPIKTDNNNNNDALLVSQAHSA
eukprot:c7545_g1_i1.p1 GENE.c7545_g1_i1~~c7545_g1_i1.p1  ORF type:complete len:401 (-),score=100.41 c7545_g1_i1:111-1280(-)